MHKYTFEDQEAANMAAWGDVPDGFTHVAEQFYNEGRWSQYFLVVMRRDSDGVLFGTIHERGATEYQDTEDADLTWYEVEETSRPYYKLRKE